MTDDILKFKRNDTNDVWVLVQEWKGQPILNFRNYFLTKEGNWMPTIRGCQLKIEEIPDLIKFLQKIISE